MTLTVLLWVLAVVLVLAGLAGMVLPALPGAPLLFAGLLTKVGVYALLRVFTLVFRQDVPFTHGVIVAVAA